jgi:CO/xanthine dehydrogenase Mo-binding subunit
VGRPVKWRATRVESFLADTHGRDGMLDAELALDASGRFLALRVRTRVGIGAYVTAFAAVFGTNNTKNCLSSVYRIPAIAIGHAGLHQRRRSGPIAAPAAPGDLPHRAVDRGRRARPASTV